MSEMMEMKVKEEEELPVLVDVTAVPFDEIVIKQEVDVYPTATEEATSFHEEVDIKEEEVVEHEEESEMIFSFSPEEVKIEKENNTQEQATPSGSTECVDGGDDNSEICNELEVLSAPSTSSQNVDMVLVPGHSENQASSSAEGNKKTAYRKSKHTKDESEWVSTKRKKINEIYSEATANYVAVNKNVIETHEATRNSLESLNETIKNVVAEQKKTNDRLRDLSGTLQEISKTLHSFSVSFQKFV